MRLSATEVLPARSTCETPMVFDPSPLEKETVAVNAEPVQAAVWVPPTTSPVKNMVKSDSQLPLKMIPVPPAAPFAGALSETRGAVVSRITVTAFDVVVLPAASVVAAVMLLLPSPITKFTEPEKTPEMHVGVAFVLTPEPPIVTVRPFSLQEPLTDKALAVLA